MLPFRSRGRKSVDFFTHQPSKIHRTINFSRSTSQLSSPPIPSEYRVLRVRSTLRNAAFCPFGARCYHDRQTKELNRAQIQNIETQEVPSRKSGAEIDDIRGLGEKKFFNFSYHVTLPTPEVHLSSSGAAVSGEKSRSTECNSTSVHRCATSWKPLRKTLGPYSKWTVDQFPTATTAQRREIGRLIDEHRESTSAFSLHRKHARRIRHDLQRSNFAADEGKSPIKTLKEELSCAEKRCSTSWTKHSRILRKMGLLAHEILYPPNITGVVTHVESMLNYRFKDRQAAWSILRALLYYRGLKESHHVMELIIRGDALLMSAVAEIAMADIDSEVAEMVPHGYGGIYSVLGYRNWLLSRRNLVRIARSKGFHEITFAEQTTPHQGLGPGDDHLADTIRALFAVIHIQGGMSDLKRVMKFVGLMPKNGLPKGSVKTEEGVKSYRDDTESTAPQLDRIEEDLKSCQDEITPVAPNSDEITTYKSTTPDSQTRTRPLKPQLGESNRLEPIEGKDPPNAAKSPNSSQSQKNILAPLVRPFPLDLQEAAREEKQPVRSADCDIKQLWEDHVQVWTARFETAVKIDCDSHTQLGQSLINIHKIPPNDPTKRILRRQFDVDEKNRDQHKFAVAIIKEYLEHLPRHFSILEVFFSEGIFNSETNSLKADKAAQLDYLVDRLHSVEKFETFLKDLADRNDSIDQQKLLQHVTKFISDSVKFSYKTLKTKTSVLHEYKVLQSIWKPTAWEIRMGENATIQALKQSNAAPDPQMLEKNNRNLAGRKTVMQSIWKPTAWEIRMGENATIQALKQSNAAPDPQMLEKNNRNLAGRKTRTRLRIRPLPQAGAATGRFQDFFRPPREHSKMRWSRSDSRPNFRNIQLPMLRDSSKVKASEWKPLVRYGMVPSPASYGEGRRGFRRHVSKP